MSFQHDYTTLSGPVSTLASLQLISAEQPEGSFQNVTQMEFLPAYGPTHSGFP